MNSIPISNLHTVSLMKKYFFRFIQLTDNKIVTHLYCNSTDRHQYLHYDLCFAEHIKRSIVFSQKLRLKKICSQKSDLDSNVKELKTGLAKEVIEIKYLGAS